MSSACRPEILQFWAKTDRSENRARQEHEFHPLAYHLLDVAACADAILDANPARLRFLADLCEIEPEKLRRTLVCLIALHDLGKCARGFQGKVPELWPSALGPRPEPKKFIPVRHDAAGLWLFKNEPSLTALGEQLILRLLPSEREKIFQSVVGHHGEPLELDFRGGVAAIVNSEVQIGQAAQLAATELAEAIYAVFEPPGISPPEEAVPTLSFALAGLAVLADWLGSNCNWFEFATPRGSERLFDELMRYWRDVAGPVAKRAVRQAGLIPAQSAPFRGVKSLFPHIDKPTPLQLFCEEVTLPDGPILFVIEDMRAPERPRPQWPSRIVFWQRAGRAVSMSLCPQWQRRTLCSAACRRPIAGSSRPAPILPSFWFMAGEISAKDSGVFRENWPMTIIATKSPMIRRKSLLAHFAPIGSRGPTSKPSWRKWEPGRATRLFSRFCRPAIRRYVFGGS